MKKKYPLIFLCLISFSFLNAQVTDFITGVFSPKIIIDGDDLFYISISDSDDTIYKVDISDLDFPSILPLFTEDFIPRSIVSLVKDGDNLYFGLLQTIGALGGMYKIDLNDLGADALELNVTAAADMVFIANTIYSVASFIHSNVKSTNTLLSPPIVSPFYEYFTLSAAHSLYNDGFTLYIGTNAGEIYTKNILTGSPKSLLYTSASESRILEILKFEGLLYYADANGVHRFNPLDAVPTTQTIDDSELIGIFIGLAAKAYPSGDKYLFVSRPNENKIVKIDLNDATLSIKNNILNTTAIFPNPTLNRVTVKSNYNLEKLSIYDMLGKQVLEVIPTNQVKTFSLDVENLSSGNYFLKIRTSIGIETKKLIKF